MKKSNRRGFTLPEILVTVTVVAVLAAVVVPAVTQFATKGDAPATSSDIDQVRSAVNSYVSDTRHYPATFSDLVNQPTGVTTWRGPYFAAALSGVSGVSATFLSNGSNITLGPALTQDAASHYLTTTVTFGSGATCQDLWNLDHVIDGTTPIAANDATSSANGNLQWASSCASSTAAASTAGAITLRLTSIGG